MDEHIANRGARFSSRGWVLGAGLAGLLVGVGVTAALVLTTMPGMMIVTRQSRHGFDETVAAIEQAVRTRGWILSGTSDMNASMAKHRVDFQPRVKLIKLCKPEYAKSVLTTDRYLACLMPCSIAVWESDDGRVHVSKMNTGLMGRLFGGNVAKVMGTAVARDEQQMLAQIVSP